MTIPSSSNAFQPIVELYDSGDFIGHATTTSNNKWEYLLEDLTEGTHIMTAKSDGIVSEPRIIQVLASSGSEDWRELGGLQLTTHQLYFGKSGLAFYVALAPTNALGKGYFKKVNNLDTLTMEGYNGQALAVVLPSPANRVTITVAEPMYSSPGVDKLTFCTEENATIVRSLVGTVGDHIFDLGTAVKGFGLYVHGTHPSGGLSVSISNIKWESIT